MEPTGMERPLTWRPLCVQDSAFCVIPPGVQSNPLSTATDSSWGPSGGLALFPLGVTVPVPVAAGGRRVHPGPPSGSGAAPVTGSACTRERQVNRLLAAYLLMSQGSRAVMEEASVTLRVFFLMNMYLHPGLLNLACALGLERQGPRGRVTVLLVRA